MRNLKIGVDCDGVLFDFTSAYVRKLEAVSGKRCTLPRGQEPHCWDWPKEYGFDAGDDDKAWESIRGDVYFWATLAPMIEAPQACNVLHNLYMQGHEVYFITHRMGQAPHAQTLTALRLLGIEMPQVIVAQKKGPLAEGLDLTHFIDDKFENVCDVAAYTTDRKTGEHTCKVYLLNKPYNTKKDLPESLGIIRVDTIKEMFEAMVSEEVNS